MIPAKEVRQILDHLPDDTTLDDIQYHIYVRHGLLMKLPPAGHSLKQNSTPGWPSGWNRKMD